MLAAFVAGVIMAMLGMTLLIQKGARIGSRRISKTWAFRLGIFLVAFFPVIIVERLLLNRFDPDEEYDRILIHASVTGAWVIVGIILFLIAIKKPVKPRKDAASPLQAQGPAEFPEAFGATLVEESEPLPPPPAARPGKRPAAPPSNPFDFR